MRRNFQLHQNIAFAIILGMGIFYIASLTVLSVQVLPMAAGQLRIFMQAVNTQCDVQFLTSSTAFYITMLVAAVLCIAWLINILAVFKSIVYAQRTHKLVTKLQLLPPPAALPPNVNYVDSKDIFVFTAGLITPQIYLSTQLLSELDDTEFRSIIHHEQQHVRSCDPLKSLIVSTINHILPPFPFKSNIFHNYEVLTELAADTHVENILNTKTGIVRALDKLYDMTVTNLSISQFGFRSDRIKILVGLENFHMRQFFSGITFTMLVLATSSVFVSQTNIWLLCNQLGYAMQSQLNTAESAPQSSLRPSLERSIAAVCRELTTNYSTIYNSPSAFENSSPVLPQSRQ